MLKKHPAKGWIYLLPPDHPSCRQTSTPQPLSRRGLPQTPIFTGKTFPPQKLQRHLSQKRPVKSNQPPLLQPQMASKYTSWNRPSSPCWMKNLD